MELPFLKEPPKFLKTLLDVKYGRRSTKFLENIWIYNSMFSFISTEGEGGGGEEGHIDTKINDWHGPYIYRLNRQNHHRIVSLVPNDEQKASFAQLYKYDTTHKIENKINCICGSDDKRDVDPEVISGLKDIYAWSN